MLAVAGGPALAASAAPAVPAAPMASGHCTSYPANNNCTYTISVTIVTPGGTITFTITGIFTPFESITIYIHSTPVVVGHLTADAHGNVSGTVTVPADTPPGQHTLEAVGANGQTASIPFTVSATPGSTTGASGSSSGSLPFTGADIAAMSAVGAALIIGGGVAFTTGRRRKRASGPVA